jgi:hypothetical protein
MWCSPLNLIRTIASGLFLVGFGYFLAFHGGWPTLKQARASAKWPSTSGSVRVSEVIKKAARRGGWQFTPHVEYVYRVEEHSYRSNRIWFGDDSQSYSASQALEISNRYPVGQPVTVSFNSDSPGVAVLEPGAYPTSYALFVGGWIFLGIGGLLLCSAHVSIVRIITGDQPARMTSEDRNQDPDHSIRPG